ncbi:DUF1361 domain-containing protein [Candidatus Saccharibacteria bacterium]|nr:DUF1361 domain-containing protein [Candidatus Saccharibacteria bacterium]
MILGGNSRRFLIAVGLLSLVDVILFDFRLLITGSHRYSFVPWNLALAWISLLVAIALARNLRRYRWLSLQNIVLTIMWLAFLPNSWYVLTDFVHVVPTAEISQLYDIVLISLLVFIGFTLGFASLFLIHRELLQRFSVIRSYVFIEIFILIASFAIYVGRDLRWNTWDVIANPGVIINVSNKIIDPFGNPRALNVTILFFMLISVLYLAFWIFTHPPKHQS